MNARNGLTAYADRRSRLLGCALVIALAVAAFAIAVELLFPGPYTTAVPRPFDSARWKAANSLTDARCGMLADLTYRVGVVGKSRAELVALLGQPDDEQPNSTTSHWHLCPSFMDIYILEVRWRANQAASVRVRDT